jgi:hypothetical protein
MYKRFDRWIARMLGIATVFTIVGEVAAADDPTGRELYRWQDRNGVIRYSTDLSRVPDTRRESVIRVISGSSPTGQPLSKPAASPSLAPLGPALAGADPFNAPAEARQVGSQALSGNDAFAGNTWPELDARIAELETLIYADEEVIKDMISAPPSEGSDDLIHSPVLRQIAARLPILQGELNELRRWREQPRDR